MTVDEQVQVKPYVGWVEIPEGIVTFMRVIGIKDIDPKRYSQRTDRGFLELMSHSNTRGYAFFTGPNQETASDRFFSEMGNRKILKYGEVGRAKDTTFIKWQLKEAA